MLVRILPVTKSGFVCAPVIPRGVHVQITTATLLSDGLNTYIHTPVEGDGSQAGAVIGGDHIYGLPCEHRDGRYEVFRWSGK